MKLMRVVLLATVTMLVVNIHLSAQTPAEPGQVRNVILMIGDGMGVAHVSQLIVENNLDKINMERARTVGLMRTFSANNRITDSAAAGTAIATGTKTNNRRIGMDPDGNHLKSIMMRAMDAGKKTGFIVTVEVTDATPAAFYANNIHRNNQEDIAVDLVRSGIDLIMGGGLSLLDSRADGQSLTATLVNKGYNVVFEEDEIYRHTDGKLAAFLTKKGPMPFKVQGRSNYLPDATRQALEILDRGEEGFFLMVEGSLIDYAAHYHQTDALIEETRDFDRAVGVAMDFADRNPGTLVVILADHETGGLALTWHDSDTHVYEHGVIYRYSTDDHTASLVPVFAYGAGHENFTGVLDNTDIAKIIARLMGL